MHLLNYLGYVFTIHHLKYIRAVVFYTVIIQFFFYNNDCTQSKNKLKRQTTEPQLQYSIYLGKIKMLKQR